MKTYIYFIVIAVFCPSYAQESPCTISPLTQEIYHRYYLVSRLRPTVEHLTSSHMQQKNNCFENLSKQKFLHEEIVNTVQSIKKTDSLLPLKRCWHAFSTYRFMQDNSFESEFIYLILYICHNASSLACKHRKLSEYLDLEATKTDDIAYTFYVLQRMRKSINSLKNNAHEIKKICLEKQPIKTIELVEDITFLDQNIPFHNKRIRQCILELYQAKNITPLIKLFDECAQYRHASDYLFLKEQLKMIFLVYKKMLTQKLSNQTESVVMQEMNVIEQVYENIESLPIDHILDVIDVLTNKLIEIKEFEKNESNGVLSYATQTAQAIGSFFYGVLIGDDE